MEGGSKYDGRKQQGISQLSRVQGSEKWQSKINQHFKAWAWGNSLYLKFLKEEEVFAILPSFEWGGYRYGLQGFDRLPGPPFSLSAK